MTCSTRVFSDIKRTDPSPALHSESTAAFLDRVAGDYWQQVRDLIEDWVSHVPAEHAADLVGRLRDADYAQHTSAFWELYLHETFRRSGYGIEIHPLISNGRRPDFKIWGGGDTFYVEAKTLISGSSGAGARKQQVYDALNRIHCPNFFLQIDVNKIGKSDLPTRSLRKNLERWVARLDPDSMVIGERFYDFGEPFRWEHDGWEIQFRPFPVSPGARGRHGHRPLGVFGPIEAAFVNDDAILRNALMDKGSAYGELEHPLVLAVNSFAFDPDDSDVMSALYGSEQISYYPDHPEIEPVPSRKPDGYWLARTWTHQHVAGVLLGRSITAYRAAEPCTFWCHPDAFDAVQPLPVWQIAEAESGRIRYREPLGQLHELLDLPEGWPLGEAFPREGIA